MIDTNTPTGTDPVDDDTSETAAQAIRSYFDLVDLYIESISPHDTHARGQAILDATGHNP